MQARTKFALWNAFKTQAFLKLLAAGFLTASFFFPPFHDMWAAMLFLNVMVWFESPKDYKFFHSIYEVTEFKGPKGWIEIGHRDAFLRRYAANPIPPEGVVEMPPSQVLGGGCVHITSNRSYRIDDPTAAYREARLYSHGIVAIAKNPADMPYLEAIVHEYWEYCNRTGQGYMVTLSFDGNVYDYGTTP